MWGQKGLNSSWRRRRGMGAHVSWCPGHCFLFIQQDTQPMGWRHFSSAKTFWKQTHRCIYKVMAKSQWQRRSAITVRRTGRQQTHNPLETQPWEGFPLSVVSLQLPVVLLLWLGYHETSPPTLVCPLVLYFFKVCLGRHIVKVSQA